MTLRVVTPNANLSGSSLRTLPGSCALSLEGVLTWRSEGHHPLFDVQDAGGAVGMPFQQLWHVEDHANILRALAAARLRGQSRFTARAVHNQAWMDSVVQLRRDCARQPHELLVTVSLAADEQDAIDDYMTLFNAAPVAMWTTHDPDAAFVLGNPASEKRYQYPPGKNQSLSPAPGEAAPTNYRLCREGREVPAVELPLQRAAKGEYVLNEDYELSLQDGSSGHIILNASPMRNARGEIIGAVCVDIDITERKRIEAAQLRLLECSRATGQAFFDALVRAIAEVLGACHVYIAELAPEDGRVLRSRAAWADGAPASHPDFIPHDTPCVDVLKGQSKIVASNVHGLYPQAEVIQRMKAEGYIGTPLRGADGDVIGLIGALFDHPLDESQRPVETVEIFAGRAAAEIQRLRSEASLRQSEEEYRIITDAIPALIIFLDKEARFRFANAAMKTWFGVDPKDAKGKHLSEVIGEAAFRKISDRVRRALTGERQKFEALMPYANCDPKHVSAEYVPHFEDGNVRGFFALVTDISDQKAAAEALSQSEQQFRTLFKHLPVGVVLADRDGRALLENDVFSRLLPKRSGSALPASVFERSCTAHGADGAVLPAAMHPLRQALRGQVARDVELQCLHDDRPPTWIRMSAVPILSDAGYTTGALVVIADIDGEKRNEERRTLLINELNHRVKNTLASVQSIASQTFRTSPLTKDGLAAFEERLLALSNAHNLLTQGHWEGADLKHVAALVLEPHDPGGGRLVVKGPHVRLKPPAALAFAMALHELATNAVKYGALSAPAGNVELNWHIVAEPDGRRLRIKWKERGGPPVVTPIRKGFGTRLIERSLAFELGSDTSIHYDPLGVVCEIDADLSEIGN